MIGQEDERPELWKRLETQLLLQPETSVQVPGATLRKLVCVGESRVQEERWYDAPAILALNMLVGFRILPNVWEHIRSNDV